MKVRLKRAWQGPALAAIVCGAAIALTGGSAEARSARIVYTAPNGDTGFDLYTIRQHSGGRKLLTHTSEDDRTPAWSPGHRWVVFSRISGSPVLYRIRSTGHHLHAIAHSRYGSEPSWSPDGKLIAYSAYRRDPNGHYSYYIYTIRPDGSDRKRLTDGPNDVNPSWSPDSRLIVFQRGTEIWKMRADGTHAKRVEKDGANPDWSPDGKHIAFENTDELLGVRTIDVMRPDGSHRQRETGDDSAGSDCSDDPGTCEKDYNPAWSPGNTKIVYDASTESLGNFGVWTNDFPDQQDNKRVVFRGIEPDW